ncbi:hypothetical protein [Devosia sp. SD17-2]|uniref:hypothetical protein n=1 Tax=Devosia sp. SD17-2 TaxID=2976459 RepID=UPI0023D822D0|nr:hypothetical protein [Devosia sp. SD17-2]WEJ31977.1 DUF1499 domain-containing protein [Devosia sp. SD17-2]
MRIGALVLFGALALSQNASAAPVTVACSLVDTSTYATRYIEVDQIVFDVEAQLVDMRSAKTVGTSDFVNWIFTTRKHGPFDDLFTMRGGANWFTGGGVSNSTPYAMKLTQDGLFVMTYVYRGGTEVLRWQCAG